MTPLGFLDLDGVLLDFITPALALHGVEDLYSREEAKGVFQIETILGISAKEFWSRIDSKEDFWHSLRPTREADRIVHLMEETFGVDNIAILTAPSLSPECVPGKRYCVKKYFPQFSSRIIFTGAKEFLSGPGRFLVDDRDSNVENWRENGGGACLINRQWNKGWQEEGDLLGHLENQLRRVYEYES